MTSEDLAPVRQFVLVDAVTGKVILTFNQIHQVKERVVYDKNNNFSSLTLPGLPAELKRGEGAPASGIADVDAAYLYSGNTYDFYLNIHGRDSMDDHGMQLINTVRYCGSSGLCPYQNAFWDGQQMVYGDGYAQAEDVVAHELTHGVTDRTSGLFYYMQSGAINESFSDMWGEFVQQQNNPPSAADKWLLGETLRGSGGPFRSMKNPPAYSDPDKMTSALYQCGSGSAGTDNGGVHRNSGINNKAAFLMTDGGSFNGRTVAGLGLLKVAKIYYYAQTNLLNSCLQRDRRSWPDVLARPSETDSSREWVPRASG